MNSKQRRKDRRRFKYSVRPTRESADDHYDEMYDWCVATFGNSAKIRGGGVVWREEHHHRGTHWQFTYEQGATLFALKWL